MAVIERQKILFISCSDTWSGTWKDRHQILSRLLPSNCVLFLEEPQLSFLSILRDRRRLRRLWSWLHVRRLQENLWLYTPVLALPFGKRCKIIQFLNDIVLLVNLWVILRIIRFHPTIVWTFSHIHGRILKKLGGRLAIYTAHDVWEVYPNHRRLRERERELEEQTLKTVDIAFFTAKANLQRKAHLCPNSYYLSHGCPTPPQGILGMNKRREKPPDFPKHGRFFLGYWGVISRTVVDIDLIDWLAARHPEWTFVLIGPIFKPDVSWFGRFTAKRNIVLLGRKRHDEMYGYLYALDVGLLCHPRTEMKVQSSPLKVWDYISAGLPIVSIYIPEIESLGEFVYFADTNEQWEQMIAKAMAEDSVIKRQRRLEFAEANSWDNRVVQISTVIAGHMARLQLHNH